MLEKEITKGIELLNKINPGWVDKINLEELNMFCSDKCIIGQLYGDYCDAMPTIERDYKVDRFAYGFSSFSSNIVTEEWKKRIKNLKMASSGKLNLNTSNILDSIPEKVYSKSKVEELLLKVIELGMTTRENQMLGCENKSGREILNSFIKENL